MRVLVTGASGNAGTALLSRLGREPDVDEVVAVCRHPPATGPASLHERVRWVAADVATDDLAGPMTGVDAVVHLAWLIRPSHDEAFLDRVNVAGTRRVLDAAVAAGVRTVVVASSIAAYSPGPGRVVDESWPAEGSPTSLYSRQKVAVERDLDTFERDHPDIRVVRMRPAAICQRQAASQIVRHFLGPFVPRRLLRRGLLPVLPWPDGLTVQVVHAADVAEAYTTALVRDVRGAFNLAADPVLDGPRLAGILHARLLRMPMSWIRAAARAAWRLRLQPTDPAWLDLLCAAPRLDAARARKELDWSPAHDAVQTADELFTGMAEQSTGPTPSLARVRGIPDAEAQQLSPGDARAWGTAEDMPAARRYRDWIADLVAPYLGDTPLLVAAGAGEYAQAWLDRGVKLTVTEEDPQLVDALRQRFDGRAEVRRLALDDPDPEPGDHSAVVALNVLEHVPDDEAVLRRLARLVRPGGAVIVMSPAYEIAMSAYERRIGHLRRYRLRGLVQLAGRAGLRVQDVRYFNALGLLAWVAGVRMLRLTPKPGPMLTVWDAVGVPVIRAAEERWAPPFGKEVFLVGTTAD